VGTEPAQFIMIICSELKEKLSILLK